MVKLKKIGNSLYELPKEPPMLVKGIAFIDDSMAAESETNDALVQLRNVACLPGVKGFVAAMPDIHYGYGFPIGGVAATEVENGVISPGGVGYDINCGVRAIKTRFLKMDVQDRMRELLTVLYNHIPVGVGSKGNIVLSKKEERKVAELGALWAVKNGFGEEIDLDYCEDNGRFDGVDFDNVSEKARVRGREQLGTLGAGNHFIEICYVAEVFQPDVARVFNINEGQVLVFLHTGSRGFGYQICDDYLAQMRNKKLFELPDPQLTSVYIGDRIGAAYLSAMKAAANYAWANRQIITHLIRESFESVFRTSYKSLGMQVLYDVTHNIARFEPHVVEGKEVLVCVHRKGATRSFPEGSPDVPVSYRTVGQPVLIPGDMGRSSYILKGEAGSMNKSFGSTCHGAGRVLSRRKAIKVAQGRNIDTELSKKGILVLSKSHRTLKEEMPDAYKDVSRIVQIVEDNGLASRVAHLKPLGVIKG